MLIHATLKPNTKHRESVAENSNGTLTLFTKSPAVEGKANQAAIKLVAKHYKVGQRQVSIVSGHKSKQKVFEVILPPNRT